MGNRHSTETEYHDPEDNNTIRNEEIYQERLQQLMTERDTTLHHLHTTYNEEIRKTNDQFNKDVESLKYKFNSNQLHQENDEESDSAI
jgi:hypothetical protein